MTPSEAANDALNATLAAMQPLIKCCMKLKEGDPETFTLLDDIARRVAKGLKTYAGDATSFSPQLLSCAAVIRQYSKGGAFECVPDWTSVTDNDPRIKDHPQFEKTTPSRTDLDLVAKPVVQPKRSSHPRALKNPPHVGRPAHPPLRYRHLYVAEAEREQWKGLFPAGDSKKRKADDEDTDGAVVIEAPKLPSSSQEPLKKKRKLMSDEPTGIIHAKPKALPCVAPDNVVPPVDDQGFRDSASRPAEWGSDDSIATPLQHSVRFHPWKCDKCTKMDIPCVVLPDKKFGCTRLVCTNCDLMKVTCAIDSVGVRMRMQAKAATASSNSAEHPGTRIRKSRVISPIILNIAEEAQQQPGLPADVPMKTPAIISTSQRPKRGDQFAPTNRADPEPTARDILQGIQDLGRRFDLLATNERVDTLDVRVRSVETILHQRLDALEQHLNASDAW
ncbi:hypothetical protein EV424DRAFT_1538460 [Suillus variegatus]|nr:hypothetical protein EV424DRAFT_1538460 [Suillus variegatus]